MDRYRPSCSGCGRILEPYELAARSDVTCLACGSTTHLFLFPALLRPAEAVRGQVILDGEASCFYHLTRKASVPCDGCGRFLCALCDVAMEGGHWCPTCVQQRRQQPDALPTLDSQRVLYDNIALSLAILPLLIFWFTVLTAPATLFLVVRFWNRPTSILPRTRIRFVLAALIAGLQVVGWGLAITAIARPV